MTVTVGTGDQCAPDSVPLYTTGDGSLGPEGEGHYRIVLRVYRSTVPSLSVTVVTPGEPPVA